jgi:hypothetical protein
VHKPYFQRRDDITVWGENVPSDDNDKTKTINNQSGANIFILIPSKKAR